VVLRVDESKLYSAAYRGRVLDELTAALMEDGRIAGAVLVGSGAAGFRDRYSDIDLAVLVGDEAKVDEVYADWWGRIHAFFPIVDAFKEQPRHLYGFLLDGFLELDVGFQGEAGLYERKPRWRILFDRRGVIPSLMKTKGKPAVDQAAAHEKRMQDSWYYVLHCVNSIQRGQPLRASFFIATLRDEAALMAGLSRGLRTGVDSYFEDTDRLPEEVRRRIGEALPRSLDPAELLRALKTTVDVYYGEAGNLDVKLGMDRAPRLRAAMSEYLSAFSSG
jgi:hypothetical protein